MMRQAVLSGFRFYVFGPLVLVLFLAPGWLAADDVEADAAQSENAQSNNAQNGAAPVEAPAEATPSTPAADATLAQSAQNQQPPFYVHAEFSRNVNDFREGDPLALSVTCETDAFLYVLYQQADGTIYQIFPNKIQPHNRVTAKQTVSVPGTEDLFRWIIGPPFGKEVVKVFASKQPIEPLSAPQQKSQRFNPVSQRLLKDAQQQITALDPKEWAEVDLELTTYPSNHPPLPHEGRRVGVFFGVSKYQYDTQRRQGAERQKQDPNNFGLNLAAADRDAIALGDVLSKIGGLTECKVFVNEQATRAQLEETITQWLPSVTSPGDTVIFAFSGHGGQVKDDNGDETNDHLDEVLIPYDVIDTIILGELMVEAQAGKLDQATLARVQQLVEVARRNPDNQFDALMRETGVSDDVFGRWLQRLSGRQVIVVLDTCHSGGFATQEKGVSRGNAPLGRFDFLESEMTRLKDIGERDQALLAAALSSQVARELFNAENGVLTAFLLESLSTIEGPVRLENCYQYCTEQIAKYFEVVNQKRAEAGKEPISPHQPLMVNYCTRPVYLKP